MKNNERNEKLLLYSVSACIFFDSFMLTAISKRIFSFVLDGFENSVIEISMMIEKQRILYRSAYLDNAIFKPSKTKLV